MNLDKKQTTKQINCFVCKKRLELTIEGESNERKIDALLAEMDMGFYTPLPKLFNYFCPLCGIRFAYMDKIIGIKFDDCEKKKI